MDPRLAAQFAEYLGVPHEDLQSTLPGHPAAGTSTHDQAPAAAPASPPGSPPPAPAHTSTNPSPAASEPGASPPVEQAPPPASGPDSPYTVLCKMKKNDIMSVCDKVMMEAFMSQLRGTGSMFMIPPWPRTADAAAGLQAKVDNLLAEGKVAEALPWQCQLALYSFDILGVKHPSTLQAVQALIDNHCQRHKHNTPLCNWLLPRAAKQWGLGHPDTRRLVVQCAHFLCESEDPSQHPLFTRTVTNVAKHLPGGLGWGSAAIAPVDEKAYSKHAVMEWEAEHKFLQRGQYQQAKAMLERCQAYYQSLGPHWLGSPRKAHVGQLIGVCVGRVESNEAAESMLRDTMHTAQQELGAGHQAALLATYQYAHCLLGLDKAEEAEALFRRVCDGFAVAAGTISDQHSQALGLRIGLVGVLMHKKQFTQAAQLCEETWQALLKLVGVEQELCQFTQLQEKCLRELGKDREADELLERLAEVGVTSWRH